MSKSNLNFSSDIVRQDQLHNSKFKLWSASFFLKIKLSRMFEFSFVLSILSLLVSFAVKILFYDTATDFGVYFKTDVLPWVIVSLLPIVLSLIKEFLETFKSYNNSFVIRDDELKAFIKSKIQSSIEYKNSGYTFLSYNGEEYEISSKVNDMLCNLDVNNTHVPFTLNKKLFTIPQEATKIFDYKIKQIIEDDKIIFNGKLVRLSTDLFLQNSPLKIKLERTDYFSNVITNDSIFESCRNKTDVNYKLNGYNFSVKDQIDYDKSKKVNLLNLSQNYCSNIIGISTLAVTKDNKVIVLVQGRGDVNRQKLVPSGSGSGEYKTLKKTNDFFEYLKNEMHREMLEEMQISKANYKLLKDQKYDITKYQAQTTIVGFCRLLDRGGKPDFFGLTYFPQITSDLLVDYFNVYKKRIEQKSQKLFDVYQNLNNKLKNKYSKRLEKKVQVANQRYKISLKHEIDDLIVLDNIYQLDNTDKVVSLQLHLLKNIILEIANNQNHPLNSLAQKYLVK